MIQVQHFTKKYGDKAVVKDISFTAKDGAITGFIGHNGAGKSTTIKAITGVISPTEGTILINGIDIARDALNAKRQFGYVSDSPDHFLRLSGMEYLDFMADIYDAPAEGRAQFIEDYAKRFGIYDALNNKILSYSHGMRQKIMIMGALIHDPSVWILDEPLTGLDPQSAFELKKMMREHVEKGNSVFFSTHVLEVAEKLCDEICIIKNGELLYNGTLDELKSTYKSQASLENIFLELTETKESEA
ncbi:MAG: ABC transporter ATP-binding protein [Ruminococcus sp.]|nr:ABC transporter ATP-binding protein [Ruminococcus sp.]MEE0674404.1 ABC transporter ATP-binding protein [Ruminococcus sp.]MEE0855695.1 ABC transporter ATP-binding protein [Ruminococcus sp.]MEE1170738.1 ABC transporter ATP-binding protein [Ruminococcus sp.]